MKYNSSIHESSSKAVENLGCSENQFKSKVFDSMYDYLEAEQSEPDLSALQLALNEKIDLIVHNQGITDQQKINELKTEFFKIFELIVQENKELKNLSQPREILEALIELEMQDISTVENRTLKTQVQAQFSKVNQLSQDLKLECQNHQAVETTTPTEVVEATVSVQEKMINGANNVLSTAYQSCDVLNLPEIDSKTPNVVGIKITGKHEDQIGSLRTIASLKSVQETHPYIKVAGDGQNGCFNVYSKPLIYDYGGSPSVSNNVINFFKDAGTGTSVLGVDCSAYISSAIATSGYRYKPGLENKAVYIRQTSRKFINAKQSGFDCFDNITVNGFQSILPGDIAAVKGHVVFIDRIGTDPFGLKKLKSINECKTISTKNFDFIISQSSPSKNGVGLNKYVVKDYLEEAGQLGKMSIMFKEMAKTACEAYFKNIKIKPTSTEWGILRHSGKPECVAPKVQLAQQACVQSCQK